MYIFKALRRMSYLQNPNYNIKVKKKSFNPNFCLFLRLCAEPNGEIKAARLQQIFQSSRYNNHIGFEFKLDELKEQGYLTWGQEKRGTKQMYYYISLNPLPEVLPNLPPVSKTLRGNDTIAKEFLKYFGKLESEKLGSHAKWSIAYYKIAIEIIERVDLETAQEMARRFWRLPAAERKKSNLFEFYYRLNEFLNEVRAEQRERYISKREQEKLYLEKKIKNSTELDVKEFYTDALNRLLSSPKKTLDEIFDEMEKE